MEYSDCINLKIINYRKGDIKLPLNGNMTLKEVAQKYSIKIDEPFEEFGKTIFFFYGEKQLDYDSGKIGYIFKKDDTVYISYKNKDEEQSIDKFNSEIRKKVNKKQKIIRNSKNTKKEEDTICLTLKHMALLGSIEKQKNEKNLENNPEKYISIEECLNSKNEQFFILGILAKYLENIGVAPIIERETAKENEDEQNNAGTILQFISNGYILKNKYILDFALSQNRIKQLYENEEEMNKFIGHFQKRMSENFDLEENNLIVKEFRKNAKELTILLVFKYNNQEIELTKDKLFAKFKGVQELKKLTNVTKTKIIESIRLNELILDRRGNNKSDINWGYDETRGGEIYYPPVGWHRFGLKVFDQYDNGDNDWLSYDNRKGEWCIAYSGLSGINRKIEKIYENDEDLKHSGKTIGDGVYTFNKANNMEQNTEIINANGIKYKMGLMLRVKPEAIRVPESNKNTWVVNGTPDEIRPYGILLKKV